MFDLEQAIAEWRRKMATGGVNSPEVLRELENHLREDVQRQVDSGAAAPQAFELAVAEIGHAELLRAEFKKVGAENWNRPLAVVAWMLFAVSFFLPSYLSLRGWQCAELVLRGYWEYAIKGQWIAIYSELVGITNLLVLTSPIFFIRFGDNLRWLKRGRGVALVSLLLVWSYIGMWISSGDLEAGCFAWGASYLLLFMSTFRRPQWRARYA